MNRNKPDSRIDMKKHLLNTLNKFKIHPLAMMGGVVCIILFTQQIYAQPGLPAAPSQAPIDGGLGLLAAAGGVYAWKKLKTIEK